MYSEFPIIHKNRKIIFIAIGSVCILLGVIFSSANPATVGADTGAVLISYLIGLILIFAGGLLWTSVDKE